MWSSLARKIARLHGQTKVINYRLKEERSQTFNEGVSPPHCKLCNKYINKRVNFHYNILQNLVLQVYTLTSKHAMSKSNVQASKTLNHKSVKMNGCQFFEIG